MTYGWTGKFLRIDLTNKKATVEDGTQYKEYFGGMGFGYKVLYDEVPLGTMPYDKASKMVLSAGPLTGTGAPCSGRTTITLISPMLEKPLVADSHMGGHFAPQMKYAGYDAIIVEGQADAPTWVKILNDEITFESAEGVWGNGTRESSEMISKLAGNDYCVCTIGQAGEKLVNNSTICNALAHFGGCGAGAIWGSKNLKAIAIHGTGSLQVADPKKCMELFEYQLAEIIGSNNNHVVPANQQSWNEYTAKTRWQGGPGRVWGAAKGGPLDTGEQKPGDINAVGMRTILQAFYHGDAAMKYVVKQAGCQSCPIRCYPEMNMPIMEKYGLDAKHSQTCLAADHFGFYPEGIKDFQDEGDAKVIIGFAIAQAMDDYGLWCSYGGVDNDFSYCYKHGIFEKVLPKAEYDSIPWDLMKSGDPGWAVDIVRRIAMKEGEISRLGEGSWAIAKAWNLGDEYWNTNRKMFLKLGFTLHHSTESFGQVGGLINILFNRDPMCHTHQNILGSGLPHDLQKQIVGELIGSPDCMDAPKSYTPMNQWKAKFAKWSIVRNNIHDMATLCNWVWPMVFSPKKERGYKGDTSLEAQLVSAVTGESFTEESLDLVGEKVLNLHRALTALQMNSANLRKDHDYVNDWVFDMDPEIAAFTPGTIKMERTDWETALDMFFDELGWDKATGIPTRATLEKFGLTFAADDLAKAGLLPA